MRIDLSVVEGDGTERDVALCAERDVPMSVVAAALHLNEAPRAGAVLGRPCVAPHGTALRIDVVGGKDAGASVAVPRGLRTVGRDPGCDVTLTDPSVSRRHATLTVTDSGVRLHDLASANGTYLDGTAVGDAGVALHPGRVVRLGDTFLGLAGPADPPASLRAGQPGHLLVNRRPRPRATTSERRVRLPTPPPEAGRGSMHWLAALLPASAGVGLALALHSAQFLAFAVLSPVALLATAGGDRLHWRRSRRRAARTHQQALALARERVTAELVAEAARRRAEQPDPATVARTSAGPSVRIWERERTDPDVLRVRLGLASQPSELRLECGADVSAAKQVHAVPITLDLRNGPLGIAGPRPACLRLARWLLLQLATQASPADVELAVLLSDDAADAWHWLRWLPHLQGRVAATRDARERLCADLVDDIAARAGPHAPASRWLVVLVDRSSGLENVPTLPRFLENGPAAGVTALCVDAHVARLPTGCSTVAVLSGEIGSRAAVRANGERHVAVCDQVDAAWAERVARCLAPLGDAGADAAVPQQCRLVELLGGGALSAADVLSRWRSSTGEADVVVGVGADGPVVIDLERHGPHALVAGTTGAGKSELLQSLVLGLALAHPPDEINFVLIDYKGGAAFADCARLPHTSGLVTDLDERLTQRALRSLHAELRRREELFRVAGTADLAGYRAGAGTEPLARLVLVVDEFATLAGELPSFVDGLVSIAQRGRSLGVHLVLATQRPAGVVSPHIRANAALRIALRVTDPADSCDVIDGPEAAYLDRRLPGRAYLRRGTSTELMQIARVSGPPPAAGDAAVTVTPLGPWRTLPTTELPADVPSEMRLLADAAIGAAARGDYRRAARPWLPPLPHVLLSSQLTTAVRTTIPIGLVDLPDLQRQERFDVDLAAGGSILVAGGPRSGRTTALVCLAATAAMRLAPAQLQLYAIGADLDGLARLPHTGTIAEPIADPASADLLLRRLAEPRTDDAHRVLLLDGWEAFASSADDFDNGRPLLRLFALLRDAQGRGLTVVVSGGRDTLAPRIAGQFGRRLILHLSDHADYALAGVPAAAATDMPLPGRGHRLPDGAEIQLAAPAATAAEVQAHLAGCADRWCAGPRGAAIRLRSLPQRVRLAELAWTPGIYVLGLGGSAALPIAVDLFAGTGRLLVAGPPRSGRSTLLRAMVVQAARDGTPVLVAAPSRSPLRAVAADLSVEVIDPDSAAPCLPCLPGHPRTVLVVDDSESFADTAAGDMLAGWARAQRAGLAIVVAARTADLAVTFRGVAAEVRRAQCGVLLQPGPVDGELLGVHLPRSRQVEPPGRGVLVGDPAWAGCADGPIPLQVAIP